MRKTVLVATTALMIATGCSDSAYDEGQVDTAVPEQVAFVDPAEMMDDDSDQDHAASDEMADEHMTDGQLPGDHMVGGHIVEGDQMIDEGDLARFIASAENVVNGTGYEGAIDDTPELYVAVAQTMCVSLDEGDSVGEVVDQYLHESGITEPVTDDYTFAGAVLGAGVETLCPEHGSKIFD